MKGLMKILILLTLLFSPLIYADEMKVIGSFRTPNKMMERTYWIEMESEEKGKIQCIVLPVTGGITCDWPPKKEQKE